jgi:hypothetical protein
MEIHPLGTSTRTLEEFMGILKAYAIEVAADWEPVPSFPRSGTHPLLSEGGWEVRHIMEAGKMWHPRGCSTGIKRGEDEGGSIG